MKLSRLCALLAAIIGSVILFGGCENVGAEVDSIKTCIVKFETNGGSYVASEEVNGGEVITQPKDPSKEGFNFDGWYYDASLKNKWNFFTKINDDITLYAKWIVKSYTATFESNGGSAVSAQQVEYNSAITEPKQPTKKGATFDCWCADAELTEEWDFDTFILKDVTLYAKWDANLYMITFESNGGSNVESQTVEYNTVATEPTPPTKEGATFVGWYDSSDCSNKWDFATPISEDTTLYAKWTTKIQIVSFNSNGGSNVASQEVSYNSYAAEPTPPTKGGYRFAGWYAESNLATLWDFKTKITNDITLYAKWTIESYEVKFDSNGGSNIASQYVSYNAPATEPAEPTKYGYTFGGWYTDSALNSKWSFSNLVTNDLTLYAKWIVNSYTVTFNSNNGSGVATQTVEYNSCASEPTAPTKEGASFAGWYSNSLLTSAWDFSNKITADIILYAKWSTKQYTVTFNSNGGSNVSTQYVDYNSNTTEPAAPTKSGYTFAGWYSDATLNYAYDFNSAVTSNITLFAKWTTNSYAVTFNSNGGNSIATQYVDHNNLAEEPVAPTRTGYTFAGWYSNLALTVAWDFSTKITSSITIYAKWIINTYTITFECNGGSNVATQTKNYNSTINEPMTARNGYTFGGWYQDESLITPYDFNSVITTSFTLYAKWNSNPTITFETNGGSTVADIMINYNTSISTPTTTRTGYTFTGWYEDSLFAQRFDFSTKVTVDMTLYAKWVINTFDVVFYTNGGSDVSPQTIEYDKTVSEPNTERTGYTLVGWYLEESFTQPYDFSTLVASNFALYAKWAINIYTIDFNSNGGDNVASQEVEYYSTVARPTTSRSGYTFAGWYQDASLLQLYNFSTKVTSNMTIYAKWYANPIITFVTNGGNSINDVEIAYNTTVAEPTATRTGYTFAGWYQNAELTKAFDFSTKLTENTTIYAKWIINVYTIIFESNGGSEVRSVDATYMTAITEPIAPTRQGYTFAGWYTDSTYTTTWNFSKTITGDMTLYAKWISTTGDAPDMGSGSAW